MDAVVYSRIQTNTGISLFLLLAKTKLAIKSLRPKEKPISRVTIPRLEFRAELMAAKTLKSFALDLDVPMQYCHAWTDAKIVFGWLKNDEPVGNMLIDNYILQIQELIIINTIKYMYQRKQTQLMWPQGVALLLSKLSTWVEGRKWLCKSVSSCSPDFPVEVKIKTPLPKTSLLFSITILQIST